MEWRSDARGIVRHWQTRDVDEAAAGLSSRFARASRFRISGRASAFRLKCSAVQLTGARIVRATNTGYGLNGCFDDSYFISFTTTGHVSAEIGRQHVSTQPHMSGMALRPNVPFKYQTEPSAALLGLEIAQDTLAAHARSMFGDKFVLGDHRKVRECIDVVSGEGAALLRNVAAAFKEMEALEQEGLGGIAQSNLSELLSNLALVALLPETRDQIDKTAKSIGSRTIERARQYLEEHADEPLRLSQVAHELGVSLRALQAGFRRHFGRSPTEYLFDCRLALARRRLLNSAHGTKVATIAMECGFVNLGAFAARYRAAFGELPSQTLSQRTRGRVGA
jgi:AraC-like DNA-binding protein